MRTIALLLCVGHTLGACARLRSLGGAAAPARARPVSAAFPPLKINKVFGTPVDEFTVNFGRTIDQLNADYPSLLRDEPELSIFDDAVVVKGRYLRGDALDETRVLLEGIDQYSRMLTVMRFLSNATLTHDEITYRTLVDPNEHEIRMRWRAKLWIKDPRTALPGIFAPDEPPVVFIEGLSIYCVNSEGFVRTHTLDDVVITPSAVQEAFDRLLAFAWPRARQGTPLPAPQQTRALALGQPLGPIGDARVERNRWS